MLFTLFKLDLALKESRDVSRDAVLCLKQLHLTLFYKISESSYVPPSIRELKVMHSLDTSLVSMLSAPLSSEKPP